MRTLKRFLCIAEVVILLITSVLIFEKYIYEKAIFSLPLYSSDGSAQYKDNTSDKENIRIIQNGIEKNFKAVNADFCYYLTAGKRRILPGKTENCGDSISFFSNDLTINVYPGGEKEMIIQYRYKNMPPLWFSLSGRGSYHTFTERAIGWMTEMENLTSASE